MIYYSMDCFISHLLILIIDVKIVGSLLHIIMHRPVNFLLSLMSWCNSWSISSFLDVCFWSFLFVTSFFLEFLMLLCPFCSSRIEIINSWTYSISRELAFDFHSLFCKMSPYILFCSFVPFGCYCCRDHIDWHSLLTFVI